MKNETTFFHLPWEIRETIWDAARKLSFKDRIKRFEDIYRKSQSKATMGVRSRLRGETKLYTIAVHIRNPDGYCMILTRSSAYWTFNGTYCYTIHVYKNYELQYSIGQTYKHIWDVKQAAKPRPRYPGEPMNIEYFF